MISERQIGVQTNFFITDGHGSTRLLTDGNGNVVNAFAYDAYGTLIASNSVPQTAYLYCGQQFDADLGFYYQRARYLNTGTGRFWTMDSYEGNSEDPMSLHKYLYCKDNSINRIDPSGNFDSLFIGFDGMAINPQAGANVLLKTLFTHGPVGRMLVGHWLSCQGTPIMLTKDEMVEIGAISAITLDPPTITEGEGFDQFRNQLPSGPIQINHMRLLLGATERSTLGRFFATVSGKLSGSPDSWTFSGVMDFRDRIKFDQSPTGTAERNNECAAVANFFQGRDFDVYSETVIINQSYLNNEIQWIGTGKRSPLEGITWGSKPGGVLPAAGL